MLGETLLVLRETTNPKDKSAVTVLIEETIVGHVPYNNVPSMSRFLKRDVNMAIAKVTGGKMNRGAGYGLEIPCIYQLYGPRKYINILEEIIDSLKTNELVQRAKFIVILYLYTLVIINLLTIIVFMAYHYFDMIYRVHLSVIRRQKCINNLIRDPITVRYLEFVVVRYLEVAFL